jgi:hypothetical protein
LPISDPKNVTTCQHHSPNTLQIYLRLTIVWDSTWWMLLRSKYIYANGAYVELKKKGMHLTHVSLTFKKISPKTLGLHSVHSNCKNIMRGWTFGVCKMSRNWSI